MSPPLQLVTGKGGVGKSTFAVALALEAARAGRRVLAVEMGAPGGMAALLGVRPSEHGWPVPTPEPGLSLAFYDGELALAEYLFRRLPFPALRDAVVCHPLYRAFVEAGPGVRELMAIGKVRDELLGLATGRRAWDHLIVDAGASGHALQMLGMPGAAARTFVAGLAHREAERVARLLADEEQTAVHVVALPEQMPISEAAEIVARLRELELPVGRLIVNQCRPPAPTGTEAAVARLAEAPARDPGPGRVAATAERALGWLRIQEEEIAALEARVGVRVERLPKMVAVSFGAAELEVLVSSLSEAGA